MKKHKAKEALNPLDDTLHPSFVDGAFRQLENIKAVDLSGRELTKIPDNILQMQELNILNLNNNSITKIPPEIQNLKNLRILSLSGNLITELPAELGRLRNLRYLRIDSNKLRRLPKEIRHLRSLKKIYLSHNKFRKFPKILWQLTNLSVIEITHCKIRELPDGIDNLQKLRVLDMRFCNLIKIPSAISKIATLETLSLSRNYLKDIPLELKNNKRLKYLDIQKNSLRIPIEISEKKNSPRIIIDFSSAIKGNKYPLNEVKLLFVGQGAVGKTSIVNRIVNNSFSTKQGKTDGISIIHYETKIWNPFNSRVIYKKGPRLDKYEETVVINIWDFGGQEIMHTTHQFFLTKRSLYVLVLDSRLTQEENRVEYWLKIIQSFGGESPVLIVGNKIDQHPLDIDRTGLQKKYSNIVGVFETSAASGIGIQELKHEIDKRIKRLRHVSDLLPKTWFTIKTKLEELGRQSNFITHDKYLDLCDENEVSDETSQRMLIGFMHDLGVVLHFQDDPRLEALGILNPQWVTNGVYKILNSHALFQNKGILTMSMLDEILNLPEYPRGKRLFIVDMMKKFELCYDIEPDKTFLVPDLLPKDQPDLNFSGVPAFEYAYPVLPSSVITRFIVRMNQKIENHFVWRTGVVLKIGENKALVKADIEDRKITIAIDGVEHTRRDVLSAIRFQLDEIHGSIKGLNPEKYVPVPGAPDADPLEYETLLMMEREGIETTHVKSGRKLVAINISQMLNGVESEYQRRQYGNVININGNVTGSTLIAGDENEIKR